jgi:hypothetical protein
MDAKFGEILSRFPSVDHAFAYGSGVFNQPGLYDNTSTSSKLLGSRYAPMIDLIFAVENPIAWHAQV